MSTMTGLSQSEVQARMKAGLGNNVKLKSSRSYRDIAVANIFNPVNNVLFLIGIAMIAIGRVGDALITVSSAALNAVIGTFQEVRAKRQLDRIALLARAKVTVLRDGEEQEIDPAELVQADVVVMKAGDQAQVDGVVIGSGRMEVDESQLTGESDLIAKQTGDQVFSGSFCVSGSALVQTTQVGEESFANRLTANARQFQKTLTPVQAEVDLMMRLIMLLVGFIGLVAVVFFAVNSTPTSINLQISGIIVGMIPAGLLTSIILTYAKGAVRIAQQGALVQQSNAIESLSHVTVLCSDKTGTLTANKMVFDDVFPVTMSKEEMKQTLADFASSASATNKTTDAIISTLGGGRQPVCDEVPFSSTLKWSAIAFDPADSAAGAMRGVYALGALEMLSSVMAVDDALQRQVQELSDKGLRVLVFGRNSEADTLHDAAGVPALPALEVIGAVSLSDELRPHLQDTLQSLAANQVRLKVISGDNPQTVAALARQAGLPGELIQISGPELAGMSASDFDSAAAEGVVFGRITPQQKEALVDSLRRQGEYVAMLGDGVNDVLSLKKAHVGIAMQSGSGATRGVADMVLLGDSFEALPPAFGEGQSIIKGLRAIVNLFLSSVLAQALLTIAIAALALGFPFNITQNALVSYVVRGIPPLVFAFLAKPGRVQGTLLRSVFHFAMPATIATLVFGLFIYVFTHQLVEQRFLQISVTPDQVAAVRQFVPAPVDLTDPELFARLVAQFAAQTALTAFFILSGLALVPFLEPPAKWFTGGGVYSGDWRPTLIAAALAILYLVAVSVPSLRSLLQLAPLRPGLYGLILLSVLVWALLLRAAWRGRWLERFLKLDAAPA